jgi:hypothetical protein
MRSFIICTLHQILFGSSNQGGWDDIKSEGKKPLGRWRHRWEDNIKGDFGETGTMGWTTGVRIPAGSGNFFLWHRVQNGSEAHPASYPTGTGALSPEVKRPGRKADHSPPISAENAWSYTSTPPICLYGMVLS